MLISSNQTHLLYRIVHQFLDLLKQDPIDPFKLLHLRLASVLSDLKLIDPAAVICLYVGLYPSLGNLILHILRNM